MPKLIKESISDARVTNIQCLKCKNKLLYGSISYKGSNVLIEGYTCINCNKLINVLYRKKQD